MLGGILVSLHAMNPPAIALIALADLFIAALSDVEMAANVTSIRDVKFFKVMENELIDQTIEQQSRWQYLDRCNDLARNTDIFPRWRYHVSPC